MYFGYDESQDKIELPGWKEGRFYPLAVDHTDESAAYCLLPIAYCLLPIAYCLLPIVWSC